MISVSHSFLRQWHGKKKKKNCNKLRQADNQNQTPTKTVTLISNSKNNPHGLRNHKHHEPAGMYDTYQS